MKTALIAFALFFAAACSTGSPTAVSNMNTETNGTAPLERTEKLEPMAAHTTENQNPPNTNGAPRTGPMSGGGVLGRPIDTAAFDEKINKAQKDQKAKPADAKVASSLAEAYFERAFALTEAQQYAAALGDYRRALKLDPNHAESKKWIDQIVGIYEMMKKPAPAEGEEPEPLPFKKG